MRTILLIILLLLVVSLPVYPRAVWGYYPFAGIGLVLVVLVVLNLLGRL